MTVPCEVCSKETNMIHTRECEECRLDRLIKDAIDHHGWTEEMGASMKKARGF